MSMRTKTSHRTITSGACWSPAPFNYATRVLSEVHMKKPTHFPAKERGAALVIGLIMLLVLTVLAVSGMNTATTELIMSGNEQYRQNAFQAAETGIEQAVSVLTTVVPSGAPTVVPPTNIPGSTTGDRYTTSTLFRGE